MSDDRERIFERIRSALASDTRREPLPVYADDVAVARRLLAGREPIAVFSERLERVRGRIFRDVAALGGWLASENARHGYVDPELATELVPLLGPEFRVETSFARERVDDYAFAITRAAGAIAETGSLILSDATTASRLATLTPWIHVAVLREQQLFESVDQALRALGNEPYVIWCTGPSKTADVEGILIEGVHGPGQQIALILP
jgi:L-lactate dehydrogenase complex protein LldG